jgi:acylphosphatase
MAKSLHCVITGKVQGVFFRAWTHDQAEQLGVAGWVRNIGDRKVEVMAQGPEQALQDFKNRLRQGSPLSRVEEVKSDWVDHDKTYESFQIRG